MSGANIEFDVPVPMRDGTVLKADLYRPSGTGPWPVIIMRGPYNKQNPLLYSMLEPILATTRGFMVVLQDTRGRFKSDGDNWRPWINEGPDGADTVEWAADHEDSTGTVALYGPSYHGNTAWMAAIERPRGLAAIAPSITWADPYNGLFGRGGAIELGISVAWSLGQGIDLLLRRHQDDPSALGQSLQQVFDDFDNLANGVYAELPAGRHPALARSSLPDLGFEGALADPALADACTVQDRRHLVNVPSFNTAGWFDIFLQGSLDNFTAASKTQPNSRLVVGPWSHSAQPFLGQVQGQTNFGLGAGNGIIGRQQSWHDMQFSWLHDQMGPKGDLDTTAQPRVKIFVMGANQWRDEDEWPLSRAVDTPFYFADAGDLTVEAGADIGAVHYDYDPLDPVPTLGGSLLMSPEYSAGVFDQATIESRTDVATFTTAPLQDDLEVTGQVRVILHATTDGPTTDWVARLCDVDAEGISRNVTDGVLRAAAAPNEAGEFEIDLWSTSMLFRAGHRIRVQVTSSCFPRWDRNLNTGDPIDKAVVPRTAHQTVHHGSAAPSRIILPVVSGGS